MSSVSFPEALEAANAARARGDEERAAEIYRELPASYPAKKSAVAAAADGLLACGRWNDAVAVLEAALDRAPTSAVILVRLVDAFTMVGDHARAASYLERQLFNEPRNTDLWLSLATLYIAAGNLAAAVGAFDRILAIDPLNIDSALARGDALFRLGRIPEAIAGYRRAHTLKPDHVEALFKLGSALMNLGELDEAEALLRRATTFDAKNAPLFVNLGTTLYKRGLLAEGAAEVRRAIEADPGLAIAHSTLGTILLEMGETDSAVVALRLAAGLQPDHVVTLTALATAEATLGNTSAAERALQQILPIEPDNLEAIHLLAALHGEAVSAPPAGYNRQLFDWFAPRFDHHLLQTLSYTTPGDVAVLLEELEPDRRSFASVLDLGCGTGLVAAAVSDTFRVDSVTGIDVSPKMLEVARSKGLYETLIEGEALEVLAGLSQTYELVTAIDILPYVGELSRFIPAACRRVAPTGVLAYSIELTDEAPFKLMPTGRFAHRPGYIHQLAMAAGLEVIAAREATLRIEKAQPVRGVIGILRRPG